MSPPTSDTNIELNLIVDGSRDRQELKRWFDERWTNEELVKDVKQDVLNYLKQLRENNTPDFIYYKTLFHIFEKFLGDAGKADAHLGKASVTVRKALLYYTLKRLELDTDPSTRNPVDQQIVLLNRKVLDGVA